MRLESAERRASGCRGRRGRGTVSPMGIITRRRRRLTVLGVLTALVMLACPWSSQAEEPGPYPGMWEPTYLPASWIAAQQQSMAETTKARQWVAVPRLAMAVATNTFGTTKGLPAGVHLRYTGWADASFASPPGAPEPYGYMPPLRVRTVGFGLLPVEATVQISQRRGADGRPIPIHVEIIEDRLDSGETNFHDTQVEDAFDVRVTKVLVDGVDIGLTGKCRTVRPAPVTMTGRGVQVPKAADIPDLPSSVSEGGSRSWYLRNKVDYTKYFGVSLGGRLEGTVDIPPFTGCTTRNGDDLSAMITLSTSGPGNRTLAQAGAFCPVADEFGRSRPPAPGEWNILPDIDECGDNGPIAMPIEIPYPERGAD